MAGIAGRASAEVKTVASKGVRFIRRVGGVVGTNAGMTVSSFSASSLSDATSHPSRIARWVLAVLLAAVTAVGVASCAASNKGTDGETTTIHHAFGTTKVKNKPHRVVTIGRDSAEIAIALGVIPVAMQKQQFGADPEGYLPWVKEALMRKDAELPALFDAPSGAVGESVAQAVKGYEPDLILATNSGITEQDYTQLEAIAPTVAYPKSTWRIGWQVQIDTVAGALGMRHGGGPLIEEINKQFADAQQTSWEALTFSYIAAGKAGTDTAEVFVPESTPVAYFQKLGMQVDGGVTAVTQGAPKAANPGAVSVPVSRLSGLGSSQLIVHRQPSGVTSEPGEFSELPAVKAGAQVRLDRDALIAATSSINPLSVAWSLPKVTPLVTAAVAKVNR